MIELNGNYTDGKTASGSTRRIGYGFHLPEEESGTAAAVSAGLIGVGFVDHTTSHAVPHVFKATSTGKKIFWGFLSLASLTALCYHLSYLIIKFDQLDVSTSIRELPTPNFTFPAVTICNQNMIRENKLDSFVSDLIANSSSSSDADNDDQYWNIYDNIIARFASMQPEDRFLLGHQAEDMIVDCTFNGYECEWGSFAQSFNPFYGNCFTFNSVMDADFPESQYVLTRAGPRYGLQLTLNIQQYQYVSYLTESSGARVVVHNRNIMPFPERSGINVAPNTLVDIAVAEMQYTRASGWYGDCVQDGKDSEAVEKLADVFKLDFNLTKYSKTACQRTCIQKEVLKNCSCFSPYIPYGPSIFSDLEEISEVCESKLDTCVYPIEDAFSEGILACKECRDPCSEVAYEVQSSASTWPAPSFMDELLASYAYEYNQTYAELVAAYSNNTVAEAVQENLLKINVFFDKMTTTKIVESPAYDFPQFAADLGGVFGLWIGWSALTLFEFFELTFDLMVYCCCFRNKLTRTGNNSRVS